MRSLPRRFSLPITAVVAAAMTVTGLVCPHLGHAAQTGPSLTFQPLTDLPAGAEVRDANARGDLLYRHGQTYRVRLASGNETTLATSDEASGATGEPVKLSPTGGACGLSRPPYPMPAGYTHLGMWNPAGRMTVPSYHDVAHRGVFWLFGTTATCRADGSVVTASEGGDSLQFRVLTDGQQPQLITTHSATERVSAVRGDESGNLLVAHHTRTLLPTSPTTGDVRTSFPPVPPHRVDSRVSEVRSADGSVSLRLRDFSGGDQTWGTAISANGAVSAGTALKSVNGQPTWVPTLFDAKGTPHPLSLPDGRTFVALQVNNAGTVLGRDAEFVGVYATPDGATPIVPGRVRGLESATQIDVLTMDADGRVLARVRIGDATTYGWIAPTPAR